jgi:hypothetical protein
MVMVVEMDSEPQIDVQYCIDSEYATCDDRLSPVRFCLEYNMLASLLRQTITV